MNVTPPSTPHLVLLTIIHLLGKNAFPYQDYFLLFQSLVSINQIVATAFKTKLDSFII